MTAVVVNYYRLLLLPEALLEAGLFLEDSFPSAARRKVLVISLPWSVTKTYNPSPLPQRDPPSKQNLDSTTPYRLKIVI